MTAATESSKRFVSSEEEMRQTHQVHEENVREMEQIRHTNATLDMAGADSFRAQTEQAAIKIVTPFYKLGEKPSAEVQLGSSVADLSARFARADSDYKAERSAEHFRLQIIEPKVISHAHIPAHATRDYARRHLITDFPSLHGKRSFIDLEAIEQRKLRQQRQLPEAGDRDRDLDKFLKVREEKEQWKTPWPAPKPDDESLRELDRLRHNIDQLQKARPIPKAEPPGIKLEPFESPMPPHYKEQIRDLLDSSRSSSTSAAHLQQQESRHSGYVTERAVVKVEAPPPIVRRSPVRREVVEVRREVVKAAAPTIKHTVHRVEEKKRTEEVERRVLRKERRHKSRRMHRSHHSSSGGGAHQQEYNYGSWGGGSRGGYRSSSASRASRGAYLNGHGYGGGGGGGTMERHLPITYEGSGGGTRSVRSGGGGFDSSASDRYYAGGGGGGGGSGARLQQNGGGGVAHHQQQQQHARYGSLSDSLRHGDLKYAPNGELRHNGTAAGGNTKAHRVHKAHSTRDVFYRDDGGADGGSHYATFHRRGEPFVEFPPTLDRRSEQWRGGPAPEPPPHRQQRGVAAADEFSGRALQKARSYADWEEGPPRGGAYGHPAMYDDDMARLESEFRDARLMRIPGNMDEKEQYHREIPGGYEAYSRETKAHADHRKMDGEHAHPGDFRRESQRP